MIADGGSSGGCANGGLVGSTVGEALRGAAIVAVNDGDRSATDAEAPHATSKVARIIVIFMCAVSRRGFGTGVRYKCANYYEILYGLRSRSRAHSAPCL